MKTDTLQEQAYLHYKKHHSSAANKTQIIKEVMEIAGLGTTQGAYAMIRKYEKQYQEKKFVVLKNHVLIDEKKIKISDIKKRICEPGTDIVKMPNEQGEFVLEVKFDTFLRKHMHEIADQIKDNF